jgi:hypothetical protein
LTENIPDEDKGFAWHNGNLYWTADEQLHALNVTNAQNPIQMKWGEEFRLRGTQFVEKTFYSDSIQSAENLLFVLGRNSDNQGSTDVVIILDVTDTDSPQWLSETVLAGSTAHSRGGSWVENLCINGDHLYASIHTDFPPEVGSSSLRVFDVSNPLKPLRIHTVNFPIGASLSDLALNGSWGYASDGRFGLHVLDLRNQNSPHLILREISKPGRSMDMDISGKLALIADKFGGLKVLDFADVFKPQQVFTLPDQIAREGVHRVEASDQFLVTAGRRSSIRYAPWSSFLSSTEHLDLNSDGLGEIHDLLLWDNLLFIASRLGNIQIYDLNQPQLPIGRKILHLNPDTMAKVGNTLVVSTSEHGYLRESSRLEILDISKPSDPRMVSSIDSEGHIRVIEVHNDIVFMDETRHSKASWLNTMDLSNPGNPEPVGSVRISGVATSLAASNTHVCVGLGAKGVEVFERSQSGQLNKVGTIPAIDSIEQIRMITEDILAVVDGYAGIRLYWIDPAELSIASDVPGKVALKVTLGKGKRTKLQSTQHLGSYPNFAPSFDGRDTLWEDFMELETNISNRVEIKSTNSKSFYRIVPIW